MTLAEWLEQERSARWVSDIPPEVLAEIEALRAENERYSAEIDHWKRQLLAYQCRAEAVIAVAAKVADGMASITALRRAIGDWQEGQ